MASTDSPRHADGRHSSEAVKAAEERGCNLCMSCKSIVDLKKRWSEFLYDGKDPNSVPDIIELIKKYSDDKQYFDIFQICAYDSYNDHDAYKTSFFKAILCLALQIPSLLWIVYYGINATIYVEDKTTGETKKDWCNLNPEPLFDGIMLKLLSFGYCLYVASYIDDMMGNAGERGMYCINVSSWENKPKFLNGHWLRIGVFYNKATEYLAIIASYIIIFLQTDPKLVVLGSLGLFFILELGDKLVTKFDYWRIGKFCQQKMNENAPKSVNEVVETPKRSNKDRSRRKSRQLQSHEYDQSASVDNDNENDPKRINNWSRRETRKINPVTDIVLDDDIDDDLNDVDVEYGDAPDVPPCVDCALCYKKVVFNFIRGCILFSRWFAPFYVGVCA